MKREMKEARGVVSCIINILKTFIKNNIHYLERKKLFYMKLMILYHEIFGEANTEHALKVCKASRCKWCKVSRKYDVFFVFCLLHF